MFQRKNHFNEHKFLMVTAIYPGTFDPLTFGHVDLIERAARLCSQLIIGIAENPSKKPLFDLNERVQLAITLFKDNPKIKIIGFNSLLAELITKYEITMIIRGIRMMSDFDYEFQLAGMNRILTPKAESVFLMPAEKYKCISSTLVREIASLNGDVSAFVPAIISQALHAKFRK